MKAKYDWKSDSTKLLRMLRMSLAMKRKKGWSRDTGCGFIAEDVKDVRLNVDKTVNIVFHWSDDRASKFSMWSLNLRETEELLRYTEKKILEEKINELKKLEEKNE